MRRLGCVGGGGLGGSTPVAWISRLAPRPAVRLRPVGLPLGRGLRRSLRTARLGMRRAGESRPVRVGNVNREALDIVPGGLQQTRKRSLIPANQLCSGCPLRLYVQLQRVCVQFHANGHRSEFRRLQPNVKDADHRT